MKNFATAFVAFFITISSFAQTALGGNGGQMSENSNTRLEYLGYNEQVYTMKLTNKQSCTVSFEVIWLDKDTTITVAGGANFMFGLPGQITQNLKIKAKPNTKCAGNTGDMGWLEVFSPATLPITFKSINVTKISATQVKVVFDVADVSGVNVYNIQISLDRGKTFINKAILFPDETLPNHRYSVILTVR